MTDFVTPDLFAALENPPGEKYEETRLNTRPVIPDHLWKPLALREIYGAGSAGILLRTLQRRGINRPHPEPDWWQPTSLKHFGEKMRLAFSTGIVFVAAHPGITTLAHIRVVYPCFCIVRFDNEVLQRQHDKTVEHMSKQPYVKPQHRP